MFTRMVSAAVLAVLVMVALAAPVAAGDPVSGVPDHRAYRPLSPEEQRAADAKLRSMEIYLAASAADDPECPVPQGGDAPTTDPACPTPPPAGFLSVEARDQVNGFYCGPATGQVVSNYAWAVAPGGNKYTQQQIAAWMKTDVNRSTNAFDLANGLNKATAGSPRRPANFVYVVQNLIDRDGDGTAGDEWHGHVRTDISADRMPLAVAVKPHEPGFDIFLPSWPNEVFSVGHWIGIYGWRWLWDGTDRPLAYYTDSSRDEGGSTGKFSFASRKTYVLIMRHTRRIVW